MVSNESSLNVCAQWTDEGIALSPGALRCCAHQSSRAHCVASMVASLDSAFRIAPLRLHTLVTGHVHVHAHVSIMFLWFFVYSQRSTGARPAPWPSPRPDPYDQGRSATPYRSKTPRPTHKKARGARPTSSLGMRPLFGGDAVALLLLVEHLWRRLEREKHMRLHR